ncbi:metal ABC transporter ATPase [Bacillus coahuilensis p1.1.43]|uniref:Anti-sigma factor antagonist n=1 Tax=Bacillus coahuilensis p1.1.43 TaxID=1150625 RepID=A0A147K5P0_9BACI|nr:STAS domain-containing protein [Bacillus coahuilensis]KUP05035.1 metal ABC transporter ATPase [Bacillus coahuilensis p1.1.43]
MNLTINKQEQKGQEIFVSISGEIDAYTAPKLRENLDEIAGQEGIYLTIDLSDVTYMDSTGLGVFVGMFKKMNATNGHLKLVGLSERLRRLFEITGLADIMDINSEVKGGVE